MPHGEGLAGQDAVRHDGPEKLILAHGGQLKADGAALHGEALHHVVIVDVVDARAFMRFQVLVKEGLEGADRELFFGMRYGDGCAFGTVRVIAQEPLPFTAEVPYPSII